MEKVYGYKVSDTDKKLVKTVLIKILKEKKSLGRESVIHALGNLEAVETIPLLERVVIENQEKPYIKRAAKKVLKRLKAIDTEASNLMNLTSKLRSSMENTENNLVSSFTRDNN